MSLNAYAQYTVESLPNPKSLGQQHYVSDPDGNLQRSTVQELDAISTAIEKNNGSEFSIAVVDDYQGDSDFTFALDLFNHWGIGKQGANNGLLLFLAMDRHEYRFITGYGIEGIFPDARLKQIGEAYLIPYLKADDPDGAVLAAAKAVEAVFLSPDHALELASLQAYEPTFWNRHHEAFESSGYVIALFAIAMLWLTRVRKRIVKKHALKDSRYEGHPYWMAFLCYLILMFIGVFIFAFTETIDQAYQFKNLPYFVAAFWSLVLTFHYLQCVQMLQRSSADKKTALDMRVAFTSGSALPLLLAPFLYLAYVNLITYRKMARLRATPPDNSGNWLRINRNTLGSQGLKAHLSKLQQKEESLEARSYEIWVNEATDATQINSFPGVNANKFSLCPKCHGQTLKKPEIKVITEATYAHDGKGERVQYCAFCGHTESLGFVGLAKLSEQSSSSSSGGFSGGGSSGGSFGGGSSGGGGAGGRW